MSRKLSYICLAFLIVSICLSCQEVQPTRDEVILLLDDLEKKFEWLDYRIANETWDLYTKGQADSLDYYQGLYNHVISNAKTFNILKYADKIDLDEIDKRRLELLYADFLIGRVETDEKIVNLRDSLSSIDINYRAEFEGTTTTTPGLYYIYRNDKNSMRRENAYRAWVSVGEKLHDGLGRLIRHRNLVARKYGYNNYLTMVFNQQGIKTGEYLNLLKELDSLSEKSYQDILESIKEKLGKDYPEIWDLGYAYSGINLEIDHYFPNGSQLSIISSSLEALGFELNKMPIYFDLEPREGKSQFAYAFTIKAPYDMRVLANLTDGLYSTTVLMHELGHAITSASVQQTEPLFQGNLDGSWSEAIAQIFASFTGDTAWLKTYAGIPSETAKRFADAKKEQDIIYLRQTLLRLQFEYEAYTKPAGDLNKRYWELFEKYMITTHPVYLQNYLYADIITAQTRAFLKRNYMKLVDNPTVGSFLVQNYLRFGSRYDWRELLKRGTDEDLNPGYFISKLKI